MLDQAHDLRRLAMRATAAESPRAAGRPTLLAVAGGKGGVGTTTVALKLAETLHARRPAGAVGGCRSARRQCRACSAASRNDTRWPTCWPAGSTWAEAAETGPSGIRLVAGARWSEDLGHGSPAAAERLIELLSDNSSQADVAVIDVGNSPGRAAQESVGWPMPS